MPSIKERYEAALKSLDTAESAEQVETIKGELTMLKGAMDAAADARSVLDAMAPAAPQSIGDAKARTMGERAAEAARELHTSKGSKGTYELIKAAAPHVSPASVAPAALTVDTNLVTGYRMPLVVRDLLGSEAISGNALTYFVEAADSATQGGPALTAENGAKPQVQFGDPTATTEALAKIASYYKETDELLEDYAWLASSIDNRALYKHALKVNDVLLNGVKNTDGIAGILNRSGIGSIEGLTADNIFAAIMQVTNDTGFDADAIVINPADYQTLRLAKDATTGQYYGGGYFFGPYGNGELDRYPALWGLRTVVTPAIASGTALVGAFKEGASVITKAGSGLRVEMTNSDQDDFTHNRVTIRVEERLALAVRYPAAFVKLA